MSLGLSLAQRSECVSIVHSLCVSSIINIGIHKGEGTLGIGGNVLSAAHRL